ncbi:hypothetical protein SUDANB58_01876 [Streptomyces sp. enrichment culture]
MREAPVSHVLTGASPFSARRAKGEKTITWQDVSRARQGADSSTSARDLAAS